MIKKLLSCSILGMACATLLSLPVRAEPQVLALEVDESQVLTLQTTPGTVVIGNPAIADVSIQGQQVFLHGRGFGQTNLIILDLKGNQIANFALVGKHAQVSSVSLYRGTNRFSYACAPVCEAEIQVGDNIDQFKNLIQQHASKIEMASGKNTAEASAPQAPQ